MCGIPGIKRPTFAQATGFNGGQGTGVTIVDYTPDFGDRQAQVEQHAAETNRGVVNNDTLQRSSNLFPGAAQEGTFTLSDGSVKQAGEVIRQNQVNAYGQEVGYNRRVAYGGGYRSLIGQELTAAPQPAASQPASAPATTAAPTAAPTQAVSFGGGGGGRSAPEPTPVEQTFDNEGTNGRRRSSTNRRRPNQTLVTGGQGVFGDGSGSQRTLFGG